MPWRPTKPQLKTAYDVPKHNWPFASLAGRPTKSDLAVDRQTIDTVLVGLAMSDDAT